MNNDNNDNNGSDGFFNTLAGAGVLMMGLAMFGIMFGNSPPTITLTVPVGNKSAEINSNVRQTGLVNVNFGDAKGENRND